MPAVQSVARPILVLGEALVDEFQDGWVAGGAPFNVARSLVQLGASVEFVSRIGTDDAGAALVLESASRYGLPMSGVQRDASHPTGRVSVVQRPGEVGHRFEIHAESAWDHIALPDLDLNGEGGWLYFGTLAQRSPVSCASLRKLVKRHCGPVFLDLNLRAGDALRERVAESLMLADWVKVNEEEWRQLQTWYGLDDVSCLMARFALTRLLVTRGEQGYLLYDQSGCLQIEADGVRQSHVQDTVGAGDAFAALVLAGLSLSRDMAEVLKLANRYAAFVCGIKGPLPDHPEGLTAWREALAGLPAGDAS